MSIVPSDWLSVFQPETALLELVARGSAMYLGILLLMRIAPRRAGAELATMDLIFLLLIAEAATHSLGDYSSVGDGKVMIATFIAWNYTVNALSYRFPVVARLTASAPLQIVRDGQLLRRNMRREFITEEELMSHLREYGIDDLAEVKTAYVEGEGKITAVRRPRKR